MTSKEALEILSFTYNSPFAKVAREKLEQDLELLEKYKYVDYVLKWFKEHDEGEPACFEEWFNNEYQEFKEE